MKIKKILKIITIIFLTIIYIYLTAILFLPQKIILMEGEGYKFKTLYGIDIKEKERKNETTIETISNHNEKVTPRKKDFRSKFI